MSQGFEFNLPIQQKIQSGEMEHDLFDFAPEFSLRNEDSCSQPPNIAKKGADENKTGNSAVESATVNNTEPNTSYTTGNTHPIGHETIPNSAPAFLQPTESLKSQSDKTDLKRFSEITLKLLRRAGDQGLQKQKIEDQFREELTQEAVNSMSDNYCLRRRLNLILTVLKSPAIGLIEESRDPYNKKIKIIRLTKKNRNDENSKMMALVEDKSAAVTQKQQQHQDLQHKFMILRETIEKNKRKNQNSVSVGVMSAQGGFRFIRQPESTSPKFSLLDQTISSETKVLISATNSNTWQVLSKTPIQLMSVCDRLMNN